METLTDCSTLTDLVSSILCRAATLSSFDLAQIPAYTSLPACATSVLSYDLLSFPVCVAGQVAHSAPYASCVCSSNFAAVTELVRYGISEECGDGSTTVGDENWTAVAMAYCVDAAGGFVGGAGGANSSGMAGSESVRSTARSVTRVTLASSTSRGLVTSGRIGSSVSTTGASSMGSMSMSDTATTVAATVTTTSSLINHYSSVLAAGAISGIAVGAVVGLIALLGCTLAIIYCARGKKVKAAAEVEGEEVGKIRDVKTDDKGKKDRAVRPPTDYEMHRFFNRFNMQSAGHNRGA